MAQEAETTIPVRIRTKTLDVIKIIIKKNPIFGNPADVIGYAVEQILEAESKQ